MQMSIFFRIFVGRTENLLFMKKFFVGLMLLCGAMALHADNVNYFFHQAHPGSTTGWWRVDNCQPAIYATSADGQTQNAPWPGVEMTYLERDDDNDLWYLSIDTTTYKKITFVRVYYSAGICTDQNSKTQEFTISDLNGRNYFSLTTETQMETVEGNWFYYGGGGVSLPGQPTYYLLGDAAALGAWSLESALAMEGDSIELTLDPGTYNFKVLTGTSWETPLYGYSNVNSNCTDVTVQAGSDDNIQIVAGTGCHIVVKNVGSGVLCITGTLGTPDGGNLGATTVYCYVTQEWWTDQGATVGMYAYDDNDNFNATYPGVRMTQEDLPGLWSASIDPSMYNHIIFTRMAPDGNETLDWGAKTADLSVPTSATPVFVITSSSATWSPETVEGYWTAYNEEGNYNTQGGATSTYYLTGSFNEWSLGDALVMDGDSIVLNLEGVYNFKVLVSNVTWDGAMGYNSLDNLHSTTEYVSAGESDNLEVYIPEGYEVHFFVEQATVRVSVVPKATPTIDGIKYTLSGSAPWIAEVAKQDIESFSLSIVNIPSTITYNEQTYTVTRIANDAFSPIGTITDVTIPNTVTYIGPEAFHDCNNLSSIHLPNGIIEIGDVVFDGTALTSPLFNDAMFVFMPRDREGEFTIPTGIQVIANSAFYGCESLTGITIPSGVTSIGVGAFAECYSLSRVTLPSTVNSISEAAFDYCSRLERINIPDGITKIDKYTFRNCEQLDSITIPSSVDSICDEAFGSCTGLHTIYCMPTTPPFLHDYAFSGIQALNEVYIYVPASALAAYRAEEAWQFPSPVMAICPNSGTCGAEGYTINWTLDCDSVLTIDGTGAMADYEFDGTPWYRLRASIKQAVVTSGVTRIGAFAFYNLPNLRSVDIQGDITGVGTYAFSLCTSLRQVSLPQTVTRIEDNGFEGSGLTSIVLPSSMTSVESYVFSGCADLKYIEIPAGISSFSAGAFEHCMFDTIRCYATTPPEMEESFESDGTNAVVLIPFGTLAAYQEDEFWGEFSNLVEMPCSGSMASGTCGAQGDNLTWVLSCDSVLTISGTGQMQDYDNEEFIAPWKSFSSIYDTIIVGANVTQIGTNAFEESSNLRAVVFEGDQTQISVGAFGFCTALTHFEFPDGLTTVNGSIFPFCTNLRSVTFPSMMTTIGSTVFNGCDLRFIDLPATLTSMEDAVFVGCSNVDSIYCRAATPPTLTGSSLEGLPTSIPLFVPESSVGLYESASGWSNFTDIRALAAPPIASGFCGAEGDSTNLAWALDKDSVLTITGSGAMADWENFAPWIGYFESIKTVQISEGVLNIGNRAFVAHPALTSVNFPSSLSWIGKEAFFECSALREVSLNDGLDSIGERAFNGCTAITAISIPSSVTVIRDRAFGSCLALSSVTLNTNDQSLSPYMFEGCAALTQLTIPEGWQSIGQTVFYGIPNLQQVTLPETLQSIGYMAFAECGSLRTLTIPASVTSIESYAFKGCSSLEEIYSKIIAPQTLYPTVFESVDLSIPLYVPCKTVTVYQSTEGWSDFTNIQERPIASGECGADGGNLTWIIDCDSVLTISGSGAMANYNGSSSVPWHDYQSVIREAVIGADVTSLSIYSTFEECSALESVIIPEGITSLGDYTFNNCTSLKGIDLPSTITSLGSYCFGGCSGMDSITCRAATPPSANGSTFGIGNSIPVYVPQASLSVYPTANGWDGFSDFRAIVMPPLASGYCGGEGDSTNLSWVLGADSVLTISGTGAMANYIMVNDVPWYEYREAIATADITEGVTTIGNYAFMNMPNLRIVNLPEGMTRLGQSAFYMCHALKGINFPGTITEMANGVFNNTGLESPVYNTHIFAYMPPSYTGEYIIPEGIEKIAGYSFESCYQLTSVTIPQSVTSIGGSAFGQCTALESVNIPDGITYIEGYTFSGCTSLTSIEIPASVTRIANLAFNGCTSLGNIYCRGAYPPEDDLLNAFQNIDTSIVTVFVPSRSINLYKAAEGWKKFSNIRGQDNPNRFTMPISTEWQFIMLPGVTDEQWCGLHVDSILCDSTLVWARYVGNYRAEGRSGWQLYDPNESSNEGRFLCTDAYIVRANGQGATLTMKVPSDAANMGSITYSYQKYTAKHAENANWNFVGNPFPYYYNILGQLDAMGITAPITIWNGTGYEIFTPGIDTERMLAPFEPFFIQVPDDVEQITITFSGEYVIM